MSEGDSLKGKRVAVLYGGPGREREVSIRSGEAVAEALRSLGISTEAIDVIHPPCRLPEGIDLAFNMIHGTYGEDGEIQAELDRAGIVYTGEGEAGSRIAFDKIASKRAFEAAGVPTPEWRIVGAGEAAPFDPPYVVKSPRQGSSVGVHIIRDASDYQDALVDCLQYGPDVLVEKFVSGRELTIGVLGDEALPIIEIRPREGFYNYENKYTKGATEYLVPAPIPGEIASRASDIALRAHRALGLEIYSRVDLLLSEEGDLFVLEINTIPGMTETSLLPKAAAVRGISFARLCERIGLLSIERRGRRA